MMPMTEQIARQMIRLCCKAIVARRLDVQVEGLEHIPAIGPALIACRHFHHLYDGCVLIGLCPRPLAPLVALDWIDGRGVRRLMERACAAARWPVLLRADALAHQSHAGLKAYRAAEARPYVRRGVHDAVALLRASQVLAIFPEAYPNIDPSYTPKTSDDELLPFRPGFIRIAARAERDGQTRIPIVPAGLLYRRGPRWSVRLRFTRPLFLSEWPDHVRLLRAVETQVHQLSSPHPLGHFPLETAHPMI
jgi:1-acyl-sn-glycerol-3-phosphate acyltransferase